MDKKQKITKEIKVPNKDMEMLKKHFSHCFNKNGNFDFDKFKQELSENEIDFYKESYGMDWLGKSYARLLASDSATTLLKEDEEFNQKEENKNSQNLLIKGDNLEVLKHLSNAYYEKIKMIYIDPPYNTGSDGFVYQDDRKFTIDEFRNLTGVDEDKAKRILSFVDSKSNSHSAWLTFMYPRLYIAKQLLKDDGVIFISIDDNEVAQLRLMMDEIFGEENFLGLFIVNSSPSGIDYGHIAKTNDYALFYAKNVIYTKTNLIEDKEKKFDFFDELGGFNAAPLYNGNVAFNPQTRPNLFYPFYLNPNNNLSENFYEISTEPSTGWVKVTPVISKKDGVQRVWRWGKPKAKENLNKEIIGYKNKNGEFRIIQKNRLTSKMIRSLLLENKYTSRRGTGEIEELFKKKVFSYPKPTGLLKRLVDVGSNTDNYILDLFAGSGTTGDAVMQLNAEDGGNRKYILVQLPERIDPKKNKTAYDFVKNELRVEEPTIFEITKERLNIASKKIKEETINTKIAEKQKEIKDFEGKLDLENKDEKTKQLNAEIKALKNQDLGFKIFETIPIWEDYNFEADELDEQLTLFDENKLTKEDLKALLVTWKTYDGIPLVNNFELIVLSGGNSETKNYTAYYVNEKSYLMDKGFKTEHLKTLLEKIDSDKKFNPTSIIAFGYHFESKNLREIAENIKSYANKKNIDIDFITRY